MTRTRAELRHELAALRGDARRLGLVPTMGFLHEGHLSLADLAREAADAVAFSIFVNPLQFGPSEDLDAYPRDLERDLALCRERGVDLVFAPEVEEMYPAGEALIRVIPGPMADALCGAFRPGHFEGVLTVVAKLFNLFHPDVAVFGAKDFQQGVLIRRMVRDLDFPVEVALAPIVREEDGLAMSSRNAYLSAEERRRATSLFRGLSAAREAFTRGERDAGLLGTVVRRDVEGAGGRVQYAEIVDPDTLRSLETAHPGAVAAVAAYIGRTRLIDNLRL